MSPTKRPSSVAGLRRGVAERPERTVTPEELAEETARIKRAQVASPQAAAVAELARDLLPPRPEKPIRFTVDLDPGLHMYLREYTTAFGTKASVIVRELLAELRDDPDLAARIQARIWQARG